MIVVPLTSYGKLRRQGGLRGILDLWKDSNSLNSLIYGELCKQGGLDKKSSFITKSPLPPLLRGEISRTLQTLNSQYKNFISNNKQFYYNSLIASFNMFFVFSCVKTFKEFSRFAHLYQFNSDFCVFTSFVFTKANQYVTVLYIFSLPSWKV